MPPGFVFSPTPGDFIGYPIDPPVRLHPAEIGTLSRLKELAAGFPCALCFVEPATRGIRMATDALRPLGHC